MRLLDESTVLPDEIDSLGHMNVRFYMARVMRGHERLMTDLGLGRDSRRERKTALRRIDTYIRYHREQLTGAALEVHGGALEAAEAGLKMFYEVRSASGETAAAFTIEFAHEDREARRPVRLPPSVAAGLGAMLVERPDYGLPRSLSLAPPRLDVSFAAIRGRVQDRDGDGTMLGGEMERLVEADECDAYGFLKEGEDLMWGARQRVRVEGQPMGPPIQTTEEGHRFGWAWLETRSIEVSRPRAGDLLRAIPADIGLQRKTRHTRRWIFNDTTGRLIATEDSIGIALDIDARRSIEIPAPIREALETRFLPEFA